MVDPLQRAVRAYIEQVLERTGWDASTLARRAGLASSTITRFLNSDTHRYVLSVRSLMKVAAASGVPLPRQLGDAVAAAAHAAHASMPGVKSDGEPMEMPLSALPSRDLPVLGHAEAGGDGAFFDNGTPQAFIERPCFLLGNRRAYALYVNGDSMEPVFAHGHLLYVNPLRPPARGDDVVVQLTDGQAFVKRLLGRTGDSLVLHQFNPERERRFALNELRAVHPVIGCLRVHW